MTDLTPERLAQLFHETYERLAPEHGYQTREASAKPWADVPAGNRELMVATAAEVLDVARLKMYREAADYLRWQASVAKTGPMFSSIVHKETIQECADWLNLWADELKHQRDHNEQSTSETMRKFQQANDLPTDEERDE